MGTPHLTFSIDLYRHYTQVVNPRLFLTLAEIPPKRMEKESGMSAILILLRISRPLGWELGFLIRQV